MLTLDDGILLLEPLDFETLSTSSITINLQACDPVLCSNWTTLEVIVVDEQEAPRIGVLQTALSMREDAVSFKQTNERTNEGKNERMNE